MAWTDKLKLAITVVERYHSTSVSGGGNGHHNSVGLVEIGKIFLTSEHFIQCNGTNWQSTDIVDKINFITIHILPSSMPSKDIADSNEDNNIDNNNNNNNNDNNDDDNNNNNNENNNNNDNDNNNNDDDDPKCNPYLYVLNVRHVSRWW